MQLTAVAFGRTEEEPRVMEINRKYSCENVCDVVGIFLKKIHGVRNDYDHNYIEVTP
jgi:hypothetical protein